MPRFFSVLSVLSAIDALQSVLPTDRTSTSQRPGIEAGNVGSLLWAVNADGKD